MKRSKATKIIVSVTVTLVCLGVLLRLVDVPALISIVGSASLPLILLAIAVRCADRLVMITKWFPLLQVQLPGARLGAAARAYIVSGVASYLVPVSVGSDVLRAAMLGRGDRVIPEVSASIIAERLLGLAATGILSLLALILAFEASLDLTFLLPWAVAAITLGFVALVVPLVGSLADPISRLLERFPHRPAAGFLTQLTLAYRVYGRHRTLLALVGATSVFEQLLPVLFAWIIAAALGIPVTPTMLMVAVPLSLFAARIPPSIGGIGVAEGSMAYLLGLFGIPLEQALAMSLIGRSIDILVVAVPGAIMWRDIARTPALQSESDRLSPRGKPV